MIILLWTQFLSYLCEEYVQYPDEMTGKTDGGKDERTIIG